MPDEESLDMKIFFSLTYAYEKLLEEGKIEPAQFDRVLALLEDYREYPPEVFEKKLKEIFPDFKEP